jgi:hypothetical protein
MSSTLLHSCAIQAGHCVYVGCRQPRFHHRRLPLCGGVGRLSVAPPWCQGGPGGGNQDDSLRAHCCRGAEISSDAAAAKLQELVNYWSPKRECASPFSCPDTALRNSQGTGAAGGGRGGAAASGGELLRGGPDNTARQGQTSSPLLMPGCRPRDLQSFEHQLYSSLSFAA